IFVVISVIRLIASFPSSHPNHQTYAAPRAETPDFNNTSLKTATLLVRQGDEAVRDGKPQEAMRQYSRAIELAPLLGAAFRGRGGAKDLLGDPNGAMVDVNEALLLNRQDTRAYELRGRIKDETGDHRGAVADFSTAIQQQTYNSQLY